MPTACHKFRAKVVGNALVIVLRRQL